MLMDVDCWCSPQIPLCPFNPFARPSPGRGMVWISVASTAELGFLARHQAPFLMNNVLMRMKAQLLCL